LLRQDFSATDRAKDAGKTLHLTRSLA